MSARYSGITWDNPRGKNALVASIAGYRDGQGFDITWDSHSLEEFEARPIDELAQRYDVIVMDHPHVGDMVRSGRFRPIDDVLPPDALSALSDAFVGPSFRSYHLDGSLWALPLDAATQVMATRSDLVAAPPDSWDEVMQLASSHRVCLSVAGPHAFLTFLSLCATFGATTDNGVWTEFPIEDVATAVLDDMRTLVSRQDVRTLSLNPIKMLDAMLTGDDIACVPLIYGYGNYAASTPRSIRFSEAPIGKSGVRGSTIGGAGLAISTRQPYGSELVDYVTWLVSDSTQSVFIPGHQGQPARRSAWTDPGLNAAFGDFYAGTIATIEQSQVRPRFPDYTAYQDASSARIRSGLVNGDTSADILNDIRVSFAQEPVSTERRG